MRTGVLNFSINRPDFRRPRPGTIRRANQWSSSSRVRVIGLVIGAGKLVGGRRGDSLEGSFCETQPIWRSCCFLPSKANLGFGGECRCGGTFVVSVGHGGWGMFGYFLYVVDFMDVIDAIFLNWTFFWFRHHASLSPGQTAKPRTGKYSSDWNQSGVVSHTVTTVWCTELGTTLSIGFKTPLKFRPASAA